MGNCSLKGVTTQQQHPNNTNIIRVISDSGDIVECNGPKLVKDVLIRYPPGYGIFRQPQGHHPSTPLSSHEYLTGGQSYHLLPTIGGGVTTAAKKVDVDEEEELVMEAPKMSSSMEEFVEDLASGPALQVLPAKANGVWKVKLVINTKQLEEILSEEGNTEALIEKMRMAAAAGSFTPRKSKSILGVAWKPVFSNVLKLPYSLSQSRQS